MRYLAIIAATALAFAAEAPQRSWAGKCFEEAGDLAQVQAAKTAVDATCGCFDFATQGEFKRCASDVARGRVTALQLRRECRPTVTRIYAKSTCGREQLRVFTLPVSACIVVKNGQTRCSIKSTYHCDDGTACLAHLTCLDAADTDGDLRIGSPGDSGACASLPALADNGDGTVTDGRTGLMWEKLSDDGSIHDKDDFYSFQEAETVKVAALNFGGGFAGYTNWRVPSIYELKTLSRIRSVPGVPPELDSGCAPGCTVTTCSCQPGPNESYWSSSEWTISEEGQWVFSTYGSLGIVFNNAELGFRAVRNLP